MVGALTVHLDTHVLVYLYQGDVKRLGSSARKAIEKYDVYASPAAVLELEFLREIGRLEISSSKLVTTLTTEIGLRVCDLPFRTVVENAVGESWSRDPFDRLIVANAKAAHAGLISKDEKILKNYRKTIW